MTIFWHSSSSASRSSVHRGLSEDGGSRPKGERRPPGHVEELLLKLEELFS